MKLENILSQQEIGEYHKEWSLFTDKYKPETNYNVHSGLPIIGRVFQFKDSPVFRAHIFKKKLRKAFDPYFISKQGYSYPYFHTVHYFFPIEQIFHTAMGKIIGNYNYFLTADRFDTKKNMEMKEMIDFDKTKASIEMIPNIKKGKNKYVGRATFTFYDDRDNRVLQRWFLEGVGKLRNYVENIKRLKQGDKEAVNTLIREIEGRATDNEALINPRNSPSKEYLITELKSGRIPEEALHDFFSFWDKE